ncbi:peptidoglycan-binding protein [Fertoebacter nigrum]|uniref:Peptidoglycan-binding protein n=1 Tax=Fertoeibacter niger TaxID=2656921 RepID=A0A8X8H0H2_9RHOB|nr:peptidoglycan-binding domain-containing protein [Fertoeibacter niger]NUB43877.1 peptidoglycan-binding protein [Fertoeibacter niger]
MKLKAIATAGIVAALSFAPAEPVRADAGDAIAGAIIGGIIGNAIAKDQQKRKQQQTRSTTRSTKSSGISSAQREANREVQVALNYFGYPVGTPDGAIGPKSRAAISQYQALLGYPATGQLSQYERDLLVNGYYRAQSGGATTAQQIASNPLGVQGLLLMYRDEQLGIRTASSTSGKYGGLPAEVAASVDEIALNSDPTGTQLVQKAGFIQLADMNQDGRTDYLLDTSVTGSAFWCNATACAVRVFVSTPEGYRRNDFQAFNVTPAMFDCQRGDCTLIGQGGQGTVMAATPAAPPPPSGTIMAGALPTLPVPSAQPVVSAAVPTAQPGLPTFLETGPTTVSLASHCNKISLMTNTNGGYTSAAAMTDAGFALGEQFCLARTYAMATGEELAGKVPGFTPQQISQQCQAFGPVLKDHVSALSLKPRDEVLQGVQGFILASGMAPAQLAGTATICLGVGYTTDNMDVAIGSALLLTVLGEKAYGELLGHHLSQGFGASVRPDLALQWYETGLEAMQAGGSIFAPGLPDRTELIRKAAYTIGGRADLLPPATLPVFAPLTPEAPAPVEQAAVQVPAPAPVVAAPVVAAPVPLLPEPVAAAGGAPVAAGQVLSMAAKLPFLLIGQ